MCRYLGEMEGHKAYAQGIMCALALLRSKATLEEGAKMVDEYLAAIPAQMKVLTGYMEEEAEYAVSLS